LRGGVARRIFFSRHHLPPSNPAHEGPRIKAPFRKASQRGLHKKVPWSGTCAVARRLAIEFAPSRSMIEVSREGGIMSLGEQVAEHLPYLRRFARAVTGSQKSGDAYVVSTLEAMLADPEVFPRDLPPRVGLYHTFLKILNSIPLNCEGGERPAHPGLEAI